MADSNTASLRRLLAQALYDMGEWNESHAMFEALAAEDTLTLSFTPLGYLGIDAARRGDTAAAEAMVTKMHRVERPCLRGENRFWEARIAGIARVSCWQARSDAAE